MNSVRDSEASGRTGFTDKRIAAGGGSAATARIEARIRGTWR